MSFEVAVGVVLAQEGEHANDPRDPGGDTWYGISRAAYPRLEPWPPTRETAIALYRRDYWEAAGCDRLPPPIALCVFDTCVNMGRQRGVRLLQEVLGVPTDGIVGPETAGAAAERDQADLCAAYLTRRVLVYTTLTTFPHFGRGWVRRCFEVYRAALGLRGAAA